MRSGNSNVHLDISMEEKKVDPKAPARRKRQNRNQKNMKSAEEVEAWIKQLAVYKRQSFDNEFLNATLPMMKALRPPLKLNSSNNSDRDVEMQELPHPTMWNSKWSETEMEVAEVKDILRNSQEALKNAQEVQKREREEERRVQELLKQPGLCEQIKALNKETDAKSDKSDQSQSPHLG